MIHYDIFVTVGNDRRDFSRLFKLLCTMERPKDWRVLVQFGYSKIDEMPKEFTLVDFLSREEFSSYLKSSKVVICHAGAGTLLSCLQLGKKPYVLPRLGSLSEHLDDHQLDIYNEFIDSGWCLPFEGELDANASLKVKPQLNDNSLAADLISLGWI